MKKKFFFASLQSLKKGVGSGVGSGSISQRYRSADPDLDPHQNVSDPINFFSFEDSAWVFIGGLPYELTEGDVICVFSQYGEVVHINLIRDHTTGKSRVSQA